VLETRYLFWLLVPGPVLGLLAFRPLLPRRHTSAP